MQQNLYDSHLCSDVLDFEPGASPQRPRVPTAVMECACAAGQATQPRAIALASIQWIHGVPSDQLGSTFILEAILAAFSSEELPVLLSLQLGE